VEDQGGPGEDLGGTKEELGGGRTNAWRATNTLAYRECEMGQDASELCVPFA